MTDRDLEQSRCLDAIRSSLIEKKRALVQAATGYGKGKIIADICLTTKVRTLVVTPRINLVDDLSSRIKDCTIYCAGLNSKELSQVTVSTKQSLKPEIFNSFDMVLIDEAHNYPEEYFEQLKDKFVVGFTATPWRESGVIHGLGKFFDKLDYSFGIKEAIDAGYLCDYKIFGMSSEFDVSKFKRLKRDYTEKEVKEIVDSAKHEDQVAELIKIANTYGRRKVAVLCASIDHAEKINTEVNKIESSVIIHSGLKDAKDILDSFRVNNSRFAISVMMMTEGFDMAQIDFVVFLRPGKSSRLMVQACGRGLRLDPENPNKWCLLADYGSVFFSCGTPKAPIIPERGKTKKQIEDEIPLRRCEQCFCMYDKNEFLQCPECGYKNIRDVESGLSRSAIVETKELLLNGSNLYFKDGYKTVKKTFRGQPYVVLRTTLGYITIFGPKAYGIYKALLTGNTLCSFQKYENKAGKISWKFTSLCE